MNFERCELSSLDHGRFRETRSTIARFRIEFPCRKFSDWPRSPVVTDRKLAETSHREIPLGTLGQFRDFFPPFFLSSIFFLFSFWNRETLSMVEKRDRGCWSVGWKFLVDGLKSCWNWKWLCLIMFVTLWVLIHRTNCFYELLEYTCTLIKLIEYFIFITIKNGNVNVC